MFHNFLVFVTGFKVITFKNPYLGNTCVPFQHWACSLECARALEVPARQEQITKARELDSRYEKYIHECQSKFEGGKKEKPGLQCFHRKHKDSVDSEFSFDISDVSSLSYSEEHSLSDKHSCAILWSDYSQSWHCWMWQKLREGMISWWRRRSYMQSRVFAGHTRHDPVSFNGPYSDLIGRLVWVDMSLSVQRHSHHSAENYINLPV